MKRCVACWNLDTGERTKRACGRKATHDEGGSPRTDYPCYCPAHAASRLESDHLHRKAAREQRKREMEADVAVRIASGTLRAAAVRFAHHEGAEADSDALDILLEAAVRYANALEEQDRARVPL